MSRSEFHRLGSGAVPTIPSRSDAKTEWRARAGGGDEGWTLEVRSQIATVTEQTAAMLGHELVGVYLHGSLAMGCFNPRRSDLDLLIITHARMRAPERRSMMQLMIEQSQRPAPIEISTMTRDHLRPWRHPAPYDLHFSESWRGRYVDALGANSWHSDNDEDRYDPDLAAHVTVTRARGLCLWGEPIQAVFPEVPAEHMRASLALDLAESLRTITLNPVYTVLNCCRSLAYLREGVVLSKAEGGLYALAVAPAAVAPIVRRVLDAYTHGDGSDDRFDETELTTFGDFARDALTPLLAGESSQRK